MIKVFEIIVCMYLKTISPDRTRFRFVCSIYNWPISPKNIGQAILVGKFCHCRIKHVQRNLIIVMHVIYNWLLNKHICIIILEILFDYQIKSTCNKIKLIQSCYRIEFQVYAFITDQIIYIEIHIWLKWWNCVNRMFMKTNTHIWKY
jgi:hypothetical protein